MTTHAEVFTRIYAENAWGGSGKGSDPAAAAPYCRFIEGYIWQHSIRSVLDLGCGDLRVANAIAWGPARYTGIDIVAPPGMWQADIRTCPLPAADLVLCKDVLQHWGNGDITAMLPRLAGYPHVLITGSAEGIRTNTDVETGGFRCVDLAAPPFCWPVTEVLRWHGDEWKTVVRLGDLPQRIEQHVPAGGPVGEDLQAAADAGRPDPPVLMRRRLAVA